MAGVHVASCVTDEDARYEDAWHWFWDQIASILMGILGKLPRDCYMCGLEGRKDSGPSVHTIHP